MELSVPDGAGAPGAQGVALIPRERHWGGVCPWAGAFDPGPAGQRAQTASCGAVGAARLCPSCAVLTPPPVTEVSRVAPLQVMAPAGCNSYYGPSPFWSRGPHWGMGPRGQGARLWWEGCREPGLGQHPKVVKGNGMGAQVGGFSLTLCRLDRLSLGLSGWITFPPKPDTGSILCAPPDCSQLWEGLCFGSQAG